MKNKIFNLTVILLIIRTNSCLAQPDWNTLGNTATFPATDYVGTTDNNPVQFTTNGTFPVQMILDVSGNLGIGIASPLTTLDIAGSIRMPQNATINLDGGTGPTANQVFIANPVPSVIIMGINAGTSLAGATACVFIGENAGSANTTAGGNTYLGWSSGEFATGRENTFLGSRSGNGIAAGTPFTGNSNVIIGVSAGQLSKTGNNNCFMGVSAGLNNNADDNVFIGANCGTANDGGRQNAFLGSGSGNSNVGGSENLFGGYHSGFTTNESRNVFLGAIAGFTNSSGLLNTFSGYSSGNLNTVSENSFYGGFSGEQNSTGLRNTFIGTYSGRVNTTAPDNTFCGFNSGVVNIASQNTFTGSTSGNSNTTGQDNSFLGFQSGFSNRTGKQNSFTGSQSGYTNSAADDNTFNGFKAGYLNTGSSNTFLGSFSGTTNNTGTNNTFSGNKSGQNNQSGSFNVIIGDAAGTTCTGGSKNTMIGAAANCTANATNQIALGYGAEATTDNTMILGKAVNVGIGLSGVIGGPIRKLEIVDASNPQFRLSNLYSTAYTDFTSTSTGDLLVNPFKSSNQKVGIGLTAGTPPTEVLDVNGNARIRTITAGTGSTNNYLVTGENAVSGTLHKLNFSGVTTDVLHGDGNWGSGGAGDVTACSLVSTDLFYIPKWTNITSKQLCKSIIFNDATGVGINTNTPQYIFNTAGKSMFAMSSLSAPCSTYNSLSYPLSVLSNNGIQGGPAGIGVFSTGSSLIPNDELNIYADGNGITNFRFLDHNVNFHSINVTTSGLSYIGFNAAEYAVVLKDNFASSPSQPSGLYGKLYVEAQTTSTPTHSYAISANNTNTNYSSGAFPAAIKAEITTTTNTWVNNGIIAKAENSTAANNGLYSTASSSNATSWNRGGQFFATNGYNTSGIETDVSGAVNNNYGGALYAHGSATNFGVKGTAIGGSSNYGFYGTASVIPANCFTGFCTQAAGYFSGDVYITGTSYGPSDSILKTNILPFQNASSLLSQMLPHTFYFDTINYPQMHFTSGQQYGLIAEELEQIIPQYVKAVSHPAEYDSSGTVLSPAVIYKGINYSGLIPLLVGGINEQKSVIDSLNIRLSNLEAIVNICCNIAPKGTGSNIGENNNQSIELKNITTVFLDQNKPNPFSTQTDIDYYLPEEVLSAEMLFYDQTGQNIKSVNLKERGKGSLHVYSPDLKNGTYTYSLVADGNVIETKTMVKTK